MLFKDIKKIQKEIWNIAEQEDLKNTGYIAKSHII